ncbi:uncharacterized protein FYW47_007754 [Aplochiton taeniatus]
MICNPALGAHVCVTVYILFVTGCVAQKVYFTCGAKVDVVDVQGLILSPGFPYNYSSGMHCVWQFFVPAGHQLILEMFDFDVFESHDTAAPYAALYDPQKEEAAGASRPLSDENPLSVKGPVPPSDRDRPKASPPFQSHEVKQVVVQEQSAKMEIAKLSNSAKRSAETSSEVASQPPFSRVIISGAQTSGDKTANSVSSPLLRGDPNPNPDSGHAVEETTPNPPLHTETPAVSLETQQPVMDACPHDVLYISDLVTFSSRFCGSNRPSSSQLEFGSGQEMVEVIMELITTTHWGRGFALLFQYHNHTEPGGGQRTFVPAASKVDSLLAAVSGAAFLAMVLTSVLCVIFRPKLCPKRASSCSTNNSEFPLLASCALFLTCYLTVCCAVLCCAVPCRAVPCCAVPGHVQVPEGVPDAAADVSELQLVVPNQSGLDVPSENDNNNHAFSCSLPHTGSSVSARGDLSQNTELELSTNGLMELDLGADEVFIISSAPSPSGLPFSPHTQRERFLRHSDTGPVRDWPSPDPASCLAGSGAHTSQDSGASCARPRAWSVRTFQDFLPPLPQLQRKWCSWNSTSPFTKLVDSAPSCLATESPKEDKKRKVFSDVHLETHPDNSNVSDSCMSNASYPLSQPAQRQRRINSISNLRRSRFAGPCFGLLSGPADPAKAPGGPTVPASSPECSPGSSAGQHQKDVPPTGKRREFASEGDHISGPVFAISEEEDRQPLVLAEHPGPSFSSANTPMLNGSVLGPYDGKGPSPQANSPLLQRARPEWRAWGSQASGGPSPFSSDSPSGTTDSKSAFVHNTAIHSQLPLLSQSTVPCSVTGKEM